MAITGLYSSTFPIFYLSLFLSCALFLYLALPLYIYTLLLIVVVYSNIIFVKEPQLANNYVTFANISHIYMDIYGNKKKLLLV